jgi:ABC-type glycerol-3-phosphate transport system substrate-binding protein
VKKRQVIALLASIFLVMMLVLSACGTATPTTPTTPTTPAAPTTPTTPTTPAAPQVVTQQVDKVYKVINAQGSYIPVQTVAIAARLSTLDGATIYFTQSEANPRIMPELYRRLTADYPKANWNITTSASFGDQVPAADLLKNAKAVIRGIAW